MKKIKLFLGVALFGAMSFGAFSAYEHYTMSEEERFLLINVEALTDPEVGYGYTCRCHNDGKCYGGQAISFRPACLKYVSSQPGFLDCSEGNGNC